MLLFYSDEKSGKQYEIYNNTNVEHLFRKLQGFIYKNNGLMIKRR